MSFLMPKYKDPNFSQDFLKNAPDAVLVPAPKDGVVPDNYHALSIFPEYFKIEGRWLLAEDSRMDCVPIYKDGKIEVVEFRNIEKGDLVVVGRTEDASEGIYVYAGGFQEKSSKNDDVFQFRSGRSRETSYSKDYDELIELLKYEKENDGYIVWVLGPAVSFDAGAREAVGSLAKKGYMQALLAGNALATHDLEGAYLGTALGQDIYTTVSYQNGHYNHLDVINKVREYGSIPKFIEGEKLDSGIICSLVKNNIPFVLAGSIRDDGPLPEVFGNVYEAQDNMRFHQRKATTVIMIATQLHSIATGNMTPSYRPTKNGIRPVYLYSIDVSEFAVNKLIDRGTLGVKTIVTNAQDFVRKLNENLD